MGITDMVNRVEEVLKEAGQLQFTLVAETLRNSTRFPAMTDRLRKNAVCFDNLAAIKPIEKTYAFVPEEFERADFPSLVANRRCAALIDLLVALEGKFWETVWSAAEERKQVTVRAGWQVFGNFAYAYDKEAKCRWLPCLERDDDTRKLALATKLENWRTFYDSDCMLKETVLVPTGLLVVPVMIEHKIEFRPMFAKKVAFKTIMAGKQEEVACGQ